MITPIKLNSLHSKIMGVVLLVVLSFNFLLHLTIWLIETSYSDIGNRPINNWLDQSIISSAQQHIDSASPTRLTTFLSTFCEAPGHTITYSGQKYAEVAIEHMYLLDDKGEYMWSCDGTLPEQNAFVNLPISSRDDVADAITGRYNSGIEKAGIDRFLIVKGLYNGDGSIHQVLVSEQTWKRYPDFSMALYYPIEVIKRGVAWSTASVIIAFLPALAVAFLIASRISKKVKEITQVIGQWSKGNFAAQLKVNTSDETGKALLHLNQMARDIRILVENKQALAEKSERDRIAAELHDTVKQLLYANNLQLAAASTSLKSDDKKAYEILQHAIATNKKAFGNINVLIETLKPMEWENSSLSMVLKQEIAHWGSVKNIAINFDIEDNIKLSADASYVLYRCVHEALQNISKHSNASQVSVLMHLKGTQLVCIIKDDGIGLTADIGNQGQGLALMRSRLEAVKGTIDISSSNGCIVTIKIGVSQ